MWWLYIAGPYTKFKAKIETGQRPYECPKKMHRAHTALCIKKMFSTKETHTHLFSFGICVCVGKNNKASLRGSAQTTGLCTENARIYNWKFIRQFGMNVHSNILNYTMLWFLLYEQRQHNADCFV